MSKFSYIAVGILLSLALVAPSPAQNFFSPDHSPGVAEFFADDSISVSRPIASEIPDPRAVMPSDVALRTYLEHARHQMAELGATSDLTIVEAVLPDSSQRGRFELHRVFSAPRSLAFTSVSFVGDTFVKTNIINRFLQSEVEHVEKGNGAQSAITADNYHFSYKGTDTLNGQTVHVFQVKPRKKRVGLFKGKIYLDAYSGSLRRSEGTLAKSPSFFVKRISFTQDYADVTGFSLPVRMHSVAQTRLVGRAIVDVVHQDYQASPIQSSSSTQVAAGK
ncbi:MAG TPA: hypothetical protein VEG30_10575 [Terriglobales bacterium]|nr:hypothetical protein [Terriglobales bacterium]